MYLLLSIEYDFVSSHVVKDLISIHCLAQRHDLFGHEPIILLVY